MPLQHASDANRLEPGVAGYEEANNEASGADGSGACCRLARRSAARRRGACGAALGDAAMAPTRFSETAASRAELNLGVGKSVIVDLPRDAAEVVVANPSVANAVVRSSRRLYVIAMSGGQTTVFAMDAQGRQIATIEISVGRDIAELDRILKTAMPGTNIVLRTVNDTIILTGEVDSAGEAQKALDIANGFVSQANAGAGRAAAAVSRRRRAPPVPAVTRYPSDRRRAPTARSSTRW